MKREFAVVLVPRITLNAGSEPVRVRFGVFIAKRGSFSKTDIKKVDLGKNEALGRRLVIDSPQFQEFINSKNAERIRKIAGRLGAFRMGKMAWRIESAPDSTPYWVIENHFPFSKLREAEFSGILGKRIGAWIDFAVFGFIHKSSKVHSFKYGHGVSPIRVERITKRGGNPFGINHIKEERAMARSVIMKRKP